MSKIEKSSVAVIKRVDALLTVSLIVTREIGERFLYVIPHGTFLNGFRLDRCEKNAPGARKMVRRSSWRYEIAFPAHEVGGGVTLVGGTVRAQLSGDETTDAITYEPINLSTLAVKAPPRPRAPQVDVTVTDEIINIAVPKDSGHCMIADAVRLAVPEAQNIAVDLQTIRWSDPKKRFRYTYLTPRIAQKALIDFDDEIKPESFSFRIRAGQVTRMSSPSRRKKKPLPADVVSLVERDEAETVLEASVSSRATIVNRTPSRRAVAEVVGGRTPPLSRRGMRREFGLRGFSRGSAA